MKQIVGLSEPLVLGLHALGELGAVPDECLTTKEIAAKIGTTEPHLSKVLQRLAKHKFIKSIHGPGGGYKLNCNPKDVQLAPIFELLGGALEPGGCGIDGCNRKPCFIGQMMDELTQAVIRYLTSRTLHEFITYYLSSIPVQIEISVITPSLGQKHPNFRYVKSEQKEGKIADEK